MLQFAHMKSTWRMAFTLLGLLILVVPMVAFAQDGVSLTNPLGTTDVRVLIGRIIQAALGVSGSVALLMFIWGGFMWLTSAGNADRIDKGKKILIWSTIGMAVIFSAYTIVNAVILAITQGTLS